VELRLVGQAVDGPPVLHPHALRHASVLDELREHVLPDVPSAEEIGDQQEHQVSDVEEEGLAE
jgi:hypothetical protein